MARYCQLVAGRGFLRNLGPLATEGSSEGGLTAEDLAQAELDASIEVDAHLAGIYNVSGWGAATPPLIVLAATLLASGYVLGMKFTASGFASSSDSADVTLTARGLMILRRIRAGEMDVIGADGIIQPRSVFN